jgi:hypothetical protein
MTQEWKNNFKSYVMRTNFCIGLTKTQLQFLCAVADDVMWDRWNFGSVHMPDNFIASETALTKRGLIERKSPEKRKLRHWQNVYELTHYCELTPAGKLVVELLKITGLFVESDFAAERRTATTVHKITGRAAK